MQKGTKRGVGSYSIVLELQEIHKLWCIFKLYDIECQIIKKIPVLANFEYCVLWQTFGG